MAVAGSEKTKKLTRAQFIKLSGIVYRESGIVLNDKKYNLLMARLAKRMRKTKISSVSDYIRLLSDNNDEFNEFIDEVTTNHTFFFRENKHIEFLVNTLDNNKPLKIWCAASSSGEEAFSIAVQLLEYSFKFSIFASDISDTMLKKCRRAVYPVQRVKNVPRSILYKYFQKGKNSWKNYVRVKPEVRQHVQFAKFNLLSDKPFDTYDIIFCRNVMIYFDLKTRKHVVTTLCRSLNTKGYFFIGLSENIHGFEHGLKTIMPGAYRKP